jgi:hypothetical protein
MREGIYDFRERDVAEEEGNSEQNASAGGTELLKAMSLLRADRWYPSLDGGEHRESRMDGQTQNPSISGVRDTRWIESPTGKIDNA